VIERFESAAAARQGRFLKAAAVAWLVGYTAHSIDHFRVGIGSTPVLVFVVGLLGSLVGVYWAWRIAHDDPRGPVYALVLGASLTVGFLVVHLPPRWGGGTYSEPYPGNADALQWITLAMAVLGSAVLAVAGAASLRTTRRVPAT
jgi:uncharacterized membrane protein